MSWTEEQTVPRLRRFGLAFGTAFTLLGSLLLWRGKQAGPWVLGVAALVLVAAVVYPRLLGPLEALLARIFRLVTATVTYLVLTVAFFLVVTPLGWLLRLLNKDLLALKPAPEKPSFWVPMEPDGPATRPDKPY